VGGGGYRGREDTKGGMGWRNGGVGVVGGEGCVHKGDAGGGGMEVGGGGNEYDE